MDHLEFDCPHCGKRFVLTREYLADYGGQETTCSACNLSFTVPPSSVMPPISTNAVPTLTYEAPELPLLRGTRAWRAGKWLVLARGAVLPRRCIRCNGPVAVLRRFDLKSVRGFIVFSAIAALATAEYASVTAGLCSHHNLNYKIRIYGGWCLILSALAGIVGGGFFRDYAPRAFGLVPLGAISLVVGIIWVRFGSRTLRLVDSDRDHLYIEGCSAAFLDSLPRLDVVQRLERTATAENLEQMAGDSQNPD